MKKIKGGRRAMGSETFFLGLDAEDDAVCTITTLAAHNRERKRLGLAPEHGDPSQWAILLPEDRPDGSHEVVVHTLHATTDEAFEHAHEELGAVRFVVEPLEDL